MTSSTTTRRAIGIARVSPDDDRGGDTRHSPTDQREAIAAHCEREGWTLIDVLDETDVSGGWALDRRRGLRPAIEMVEAGRADVVIVSRFDRLVRSIRVQAEITERVEAAGGDLLAVDSGFVTNGNAAQKMTSHFLGAVAQYHRDTTKERTREAQARAIANGIPPWPGSPPGYTRPITGHRPSGSPIHGPLVPDPETRNAVVRAFEMRRDGATINEIRRYLAAHGIERTFGGVQDVLSSRVYLGEIFHGDLVNAAAHPPIIPAELWRAVQDVSVPRGRRAKSARLLARLGILRCASCDCRMTVGTSNRTYPIYRCPATGDCKRRASIAAPMVEDVVVERVKALLAGIVETASGEDHVRAAAEAAHVAQEALDAAVRAFTGLEVEAAVVERLADLRSVRDLARTRHDDLAAADQATALAVDVGSWDDLTLDERRDLIRAVVERVVVEPGRGHGRVTVHARSVDAAH